MEDLKKRIRDAKAADDTIVGTLVKQKDLFPDNIFEAAKEYMGIPHVLGGDGKSGTDCGKLVYDVYNTCGYCIQSREADKICEQFEKEGLLIKDRTVAERGDLLFFANTYGEWSPGTVTHVGICVEPSYSMLHTSSSKGVAITEDWIYYWRHYFYGVGKMNFHNI